MLAGFSLIGSTKEMENESTFLRGTNSEQDEEEAEDILQDPTNLSSESEAIFASPAMEGGGAITNSVVNSLQCRPSQKPALTACILSFDKSIVIPDIANPSSYSTKLERCIEAINDDPPPVDVVRGTKKTRCNVDATNHIIAERRRRQELTERFIALSATIHAVFD